jgi:hypothetical protein
MLDIDNALVWQWYDDELSRLVQLDCFTGFSDDHLRHGRDGHRRRSTAGIAPARSCDVPREFLDPGANHVGTFAPDHIYDVYLRTKCLYFSHRDIAEYRALASRVDHPPMVTNATVGEG